MAAGKATAVNVPEVVERVLGEGAFTVGKFVDSFGVLIGAAKGVQRLKDVVCELALSGGLSRHHPAESAAVPSSASGNGKAYVCSELEWGGGVLPQGWIWTEPQFVGEVSPRNQVDDGLATGFVPMTLVPLEFSGRVTHEVRPWGAIKKGYTHLADGDVAVAKITPCFQNRKSCVIRDLRNGVGAGTTELLVLRPNRRVIEPRFLLLFYRSARFVLGGVARMTGTAGQQRVPVEFFAAAPLPLPPLAEQKRIVARVDQLMALIDQLEAKQNRKREVGARFTKASLEALTAAESPQEFTTA